MSAKLHFFGAAGTVTGSCFLLEHDQGRLLVDCGMFQGHKSLKQLNYDPFPFDPAAIDAVLLTHAHIDHSGLVPKLTRNGFRGRVLATTATRDLLSFMLPDSGYIQETEVDRLNARRRRRGEEEFAPIYTRTDAERSLAFIDGSDFDSWVAPMPGIRARFWRAGHILGAASIELEVARGDGAPSLRLLFSGDIGTGHGELLAPPAGPSDIDYLLLESTYGDRLRPQLSAAERRRLLRDEVGAALDAGGVLLIPAFAVERTQELLFDLAELFEEGALRSAPVFLDSPLAARATETFTRYAAELGAANRRKDPFGHANFHRVEDVRESRALARLRSGAIIIAASGMCEAGRIRHHLKAQLWRSDATVLLVGYQAPGTLGRLLQNGVRSVRIEGDEVEVKARIRQLDAYSAHADREALVRWAEARLPVRRAVLLSHGEPAARTALADALQTTGKFSVPILQPPLDASLALDRPPKLVAAARPRLSPESLGAAADWHNDYAAFLLDLNARLRASTDAAANRRLVGALRSLLAQAP